MVYLLTAIG